MEGEPYMLDLSAEISRRPLPPQIRVNGQFLALDKWAEMLKKTHETGREQGIIISTGKKKLLTSAIFEGFNQDADSENGMKDAPAIPIPAFPHGFKSMLPHVKDIVAVHTHPEIEGNKHLSTTTFSDLDIASYVHSRYNAEVMIDKGGAHMLTGRSPYLDPESISSRRIVKSALKKARENTQSMTEVRAEIAKSLSQFGIGYYFTPELNPSADGYIKFIAIK